MIFLLWLTGPEISFYSFNHTDVPIFGGTRKHLHVWVTLLLQLQTLNRQDLADFAEQPTLRPGIEAALRRPCSHLAIFPRSWKNDTHKNAFICLRRGSVVLIVFQRDCLKQILDFRGKKKKGGDGELWWKVHLNYRAEALQSTERVCSLPQYSLFIFIT